MKLKMHKTIGVSALALMMCLTPAGAALAEEVPEAPDAVQAEVGIQEAKAQDQELEAEAPEQEAEAGAPVQEAEAEAPEQETKVRTLGEDKEGAVRFNFVNKTGKDIIYIAVMIDDGTDIMFESVKKMQQALIDQGYLDDVADGSFGPMTKAAVKEFRKANGLSEEETADNEMLKLLYGDYDDGNFLAEGEVIKADEEVVLFFNDKTTETDEEGAAEENKVVANPSYIAMFKVAEDESDTYYILHTLPVEETVISIMLEEDVPYIEYKTEGSEDVISTLEAEKIIVHPPVEESYDDYYYYDDGYYDDYYYDDGYYDYGYDAASDNSWEYVEENAAQGVDGCIDPNEALTW